MRTLCKPNKGHPPIILIWAILVGPCTNKRKKPLKGKQSPIIFILFFNE